MTIYAVGDIQGCFTALQCVLKNVNFSPDSDSLWVAGDMVNRGPDNLATLRFLMSLGDKAKCVLGNHDLHLLATAYKLRDPKPSDTFQDILFADDSADIIQWLRHQPLIHYSNFQNILMVHAGIPPIWDLDQATQHAREVETALKNDLEIKDFLSHMYGSQPDTWSDDLQGFDRLRAITNYLTRMRFCTQEGRLEFTATAGADQIPEQGFLPWYAYPKRKTQNIRIVFGHWAGIEGHTNTPNVYALDTGCVWGRKLTLLNIETLTRTSCDCREP